MEENKTIETKKKFTYEELENIANQLSEQVRQLYSKLQQEEMVNTFKRLDYLFKVLETSDKFQKPFVTKCTEEIMDLMSIPESDKEGETEKK